MDTKLIEEAIMKQEPVKIQLVNGDILAGWLEYGFNYDFIYLNTGFGTLTVAKDSIKIISYVFDCR
ncbi:hypothetical protein NST84_16620 [Paenibacillus sp. FSL R7-0345]|uniref:hypothetical protein n=1 Tax=Paenibacillus sp. FSL R7-0345 TaxID=2954535 RepID=UPI00315A2746